MEKIVGTQNDPKSTERPQTAVSNSEKEGIPSNAIGSAHGQFLAIFCQLQAFVPGTQATSVEHKPNHGDVALENLEGLENVNVILGAALDVLPKLAEQGRLFDFVCIDASWEERREYFDWAVNLTRKKGSFFVGNAVRPLTESEDDNPMGRALVEFVSKDKRVDGTDDTDPQHV
ncbi:hypothetical protein LTR37_011362 [Vermiconidia calcicola]|uniref:Uncharacterized protein n=1 Tax=Vermiconidia calcicola TaxID=1690605 RepID=A0ACC3N3X5_9PEZI|nr:hypothetical protein LTR37_011362 [Vermiconidia calcicola]